MPTPTDGLLFDVDGTLWNTVGPIAVSWNHAIRDEGLDFVITPEILQREFGKTMAEIGEDVFPGIDAARREACLKRCIAYEDAALEKVGPEVLYPPVTATVRELARRLPLFIVSNCQKGYIELFLEKSGLGDCFRDHECYGNTGLGKAANVRLLCERNRLTRPYYVGDTAMDAAACAEAGVPFVHAAYGFGKVDACAFSIADFSELSALFCPLN